MIESLAFAMNLALGVLLTIKLRGRDLSRADEQRYPTGQVQRRAGRHTSYVGVPHRPRHRVPIFDRIRKAVQR